MTVQSHHLSKRRVPLLVAGILILLVAMWAGLQRLGWALPGARATWPAAHGLLMVSGFLGTLISLERAVALRRRWTYAAPVITAVGALLIVVGVPGRVGPLLIVAGSAVMLAVYVLIVRMLPAWFNVIMAIGGAFWLIGNLIWAMWLSPAVASLWWQGFLVLTIVGERLELSRVLRLTRDVQAILFAIVGVYVVGLLVVFAAPSLGVRIVGFGLIAVALWLLRYDVARRTVRQKDLPRFVAVALLTGYVWLAVGGLVALYAGYTSGGLLYDAFLHAVYLGFVFSMIFGHAPIVFPAVLNLPVRYTSRFYVHLLLLHLSLLLRVGGDLVGQVMWRQWGGLLNVLAVLLFLANTVSSMLAGKAAGANRGG